MSFCAVSRIAVMVVKAGVNECFLTVQTVGSGHGEEPCRRFFLWLLQLVDNQDVACAFTKGRVLACKRRPFGR